MFVIKLMHVKNLGRYLGRNICHFLRRTR